MADHESTMKWKVDISQFSAAMREAKRYISMANAEFKLSTASMDRWSTSSDGLDAKLSQLKKTLEGQQRVLEVQKKSFSEMTEEQQKNTKAGQELAIQIKNQEADIKKTQYQIDKYTDSLNNLTQEEQRSKTALEKLNSTIDQQQDRVDALKKEYQNAVVQYGKTSKEARTLAKQLQQVSSELADNKDKLKEADDAADNFDKSLKDTGDTADAIANGGFSVLKGALANLVSQGITKAIDGMKNFASTMISEAATVRAEASQFEQTFGDMGDEASAAIKRVADASGILDTRLNTVASQIYAFARASGASVPEAMALMETGLQAAADSAAYYDKSLDESAETLQSFLKGNYANDAALGVSATEFTRNAKAAELFGKKYNDLTEIQKQQTLLKMVTDAQKLSGAMGQAAREADGWENVQGNLNEAWRQFKANVGTPFLEQLIPVIQKVTASFQDWMSKINWRQFNKEVENVADSIKKGFKWVLDNRQAILDTLKAIAVAFVTYKAVATITSVITAFNKFTTAVKAGETVMKALNMSMSASPIGLIIGAVAGLTTLYIAHNKKMQEAIDKQYGLNKAEQKAIDTVSELAEEYKLLNDARNESVNNINTEFGYLNSLKDEYNRLIDSNGKVKEGYEDRANFILNQLAKAMGIEVEDIQKLIDKNGELGEAIDKIIEKKQAEAILSANEEIYNNAIKERSNALNELVDAQKVLEDAEKRYQDSQIETQRIWDNYYDMMKYAPDAAAEYLEANSQILLSNEAARKGYDEAKTAVSDAENAWVNYNSVIQNYEGLAAAIISGDSEKIQIAMQDLQNGFITAETGNKESLERQVENYKTNLDNLQKAIENGTPNVTQEMVDQAQSMVDAAQAELDKLAPKASASGTKASTDFTVGFATMKGDASKAGEEVGSSARRGVELGSVGMALLGGKSGADFISGVDDKQTDANTSGKDLAEEAKEGVESVKTSKSGENFGDGFLSGIGSKLKAAWDKGWELAKNALAGLKAGGGEGSPWKEAIPSGGFFGEGFIVGMDRMIEPVRSAASDMAKQAVDALGVNMNSQMRAIGAEGGQSLIDGINSIAPNMADSIGDLKANVVATHSGLSESRNNVGSFDSKGSSTQNVTFNQYNNSPKALSRLDVYRETNSLLFSAKVRLQNV